jgi:hypothetical protein
MSFLFDTADIDHMERVMDHFKGAISPNCVRGVTTNPSALDRVGIRGFKAVEDRIRDIGLWLTETRKDGDGVVHVQVPNSKASFHELRRWVQQLLDKDILGSSARLAIKIHPDHVSLIDQHGWQYPWMIDQSTVLWNVTGVTDSCTASGIFNEFPSANIAYVSFLTGRMEARGVDPKRHVATTIRHLPVELRQQRRLIAGSMRTVAQLEWAMFYNMLPTIGTTVWQQILNDADSTNRSERFVTLCHRAPGVDESELTPGRTLLGRESTLTEEFFNEMDAIAKRVFKWE